MAKHKAQPLHSAFANLHAAISILCVFSTHAAESPQAIKVRLNRGYLEIDSRYEEKDRTSNQTGALSYENTRFDLRPKVHLDFDGSVYHPNLLDYDLSVDLGLSYEKERLLQPNSSPPEQSRTDTNPLQFYDGRAQILKERKLSGIMFGNYNLIRLDNGFFSRRLLYQTGYGAEFNYGGEALPWTLTARHREEEETDTRTPRDSMEDELSFKITNSRGSRGRTYVDYLYQDFERQDFNVAPYTGIRNSFRLNDSSYFLDEDLHLGTSAYYNDVDSSTIPSTLLTLGEALTVKHTANLKSTTDYTYTFRDSGSTESDTHNGRIALNHQLYESLSSTVAADIRDTSTTSLDTFRKGYSINESYFKRIGESSSINLGASFSQHEEKRESSEGDTVQIINEPHILTTGIITTLNQPNVITPSIVVTDPDSTTIYSEFFDYLVIPRGSLTEIQRVPTGNIPNGGAVLVSYRIVNPGSGSFTTRGSFYRFRYSIYNQLLSFYGHLRIINNEGGEQFTLEDLVETVFGIESTWNWLNVGAEYENYDSSLLPTESFRFFQNLTFSTSWRSTLRFSAEQSWISYIDSDEEIKRYFHNLVYQNQLTPRLSFRIGGSFYLQRGRSDKTLDRDLLAANTELNYRIGKTFITASYEYRGDDYLDETLERNTAYLRVRRMF